MNPPRRSLWQRLRKRVSPLLRTVVPSRLPMEGSHLTYAEAQGVATGYDSASIALQIEETTRALVNGEIGYERDGTGYPRIPEGLMLRKLLAAHLRPGDVVVDFGGGMGGTFLNHADLFPAECTRIVVEQPLFVEHGRALAASFPCDVQFLSGLDAIPQADIVLASSVLQYVDHYEHVLSTMAAMRPRAIILDRTALATRERWHVQVCKGYGAGIARIPIRPVMQSRILQLLSGYTLTREWSNDFDPQRPIHRGFLFLRDD